MILIIELQPTLMERKQTRTTHYWSPSQLGKYDSLPALTAALRNRRR